MNLREVTMKYCGLIVFMRHDSAEIWGFRYGLALVIRTLQIIASTGVFVLVVCALKRTIKNFPPQLSLIFSFSTCKKNLSSKFFDLDIVLLVSKIHLFFDLDIVLLVSKIHLLAEVPSLNSDPPCI